MITLDQIQRLDKKVQQAVELIQSLKNENSSLRGRLSENEGRIEELEVLIGRFKDDQQEIEKGIVRALKNLDELEDSLTPAEASASKEAVAEEPAVPPDSRPAAVSGPPPSPAGPAKAPDQPSPETTAEVAATSEEEEEEQADPDAELDIF